MIYCNLYNTKCDVEKSNADEYMTPCYWCNSGKGESHKEYFVKVDKQNFYESERQDSINE
ncbi:hypothetical protein [Bacillus sp. CH_203]|uniref:hypothetical protein n=1 Tax=Bacillus sp. CH_203 TaxID=2978216 RepID=UPI00288EBDCB|nr:hypothetical protein [Bacillus cereus]HDX9663291.1 hypothetical protein [Bacillus cereus]